MRREGTEGGLREREENGNSDKNGGIKKEREGVQVRGRQKDEGEQAKEKL